MVMAQNYSSLAGESSSSSANNNNEAGEFECNICLDLAQDPVITLCGHLYCWPCLCRWLRAHSQSHECPVCKALVQEEKVIPLYGRGKAPTDPRTKPVPGAEIPNRPRAMRPETAPNQEDGNFANLVMGLMGGLMPMASATFSNFGMTAGFGGLFTPFFSVQFNGFSGSGTYDGSAGFHHGSLRGQMNRGRGQVAQSDDDNLKKILVVVLFFVLVALLMM